MCPESLIASLVPDCLQLPLTFQQRPEFWELLSSCCVSICSWPRRPLLVFTTFRRRLFDIFARWLTNGGNCIPQSMGIPESHCMLVRINLMGIISGRPFPKYDASLNLMLINFVIDRILNWRHRQNDAYIFLSLVPSYNPIIPICLWGPNLLTTFD